MLTDKEKRFEEKMAKSQSSSLITKALIVFVLAYVVRMYWEANQFNPVHIIPYLMMYTPYRNETYAAWQKYAPVNTKIIHHSLPIPEIQAEGKSCLY